MAKTQVRVIKIQVKTGNRKELKTIARDLGVINKSVKSTSKSLKGFSSAFKFSIAGFGIREVIRSADSFQLLRDRIKVFTGDGEEATRIFGKLIEGAKFTRTSVKGLGESFNRMALATQELGLSTDDILKTTLLLQQTFRLSGSTIAESTAATIQLSQGLSSGAVRGQELRSVLEANAVFVSLLAEELGIARDQLIKFGETGKITSEVVLATLEKNTKKLNDAAAQLGTTFEQSVTIGLDAFRKKISEVNDEFGLNSKFQKAMFFAIDHIEELTIAVGVLVGVKGLSALVTIFKNLNIAIGLGKITAFVAALNPLTLILSGIAAAGIGTVLVLKKLAAANNKLGSDTRAQVEGRLASESKLLKEMEKRLELEKNFQKFAVAQQGQRAIDLADDKIRQLNDKYEAQEGLVAKLNNQLLTFGFNGKKAADSLRKGLGGATNLLKLLNEEFAAGKININDYRDAIKILDLNKLKRDFIDGKISVDEYNKGLQAMPEHLTQAQFAFGAFSNSVEGLSSTFGMLESVFTKTFSGFEDAIVEFVSNGKFNFRDFANSILKDMIRIAIRTAVTIPLLQAFRSLIGGGQVSVQAAPSIADFNSFGSNITPAFAKGGAFGGQPGGQLGIFGEAGPEAILPLTRGSGGELGVKAVGAGAGEAGTTVNIFNNTDSKVEVNETTGPDGKKQLDFIISNKVKGMIANGELDRPMQTTYGVRRQGS